MPSTNKTDHYGLTQYLPSDIPSYLVDYNSDMEKIDQTLYTLSQGEGSKLEYVVINYTNTDLDAVSNIDYPEGYTSENCVVISFMIKSSTSQQGFTTKTRYVEGDDVYDLVCQLSPLSVRILDTYSFIKNTAFQYRIVLMKIGE